MDKKLPSVRVLTRRADELRQQKVLVAIDAWPANSSTPLGHIVRSMGSLDDKSVETAALLHVRTHLNRLLHCTTSTHRPL